MLSQTPYELAALRDSLRALRLRLDARSTEVLDLWASGLGLSEIARRLGVSQSAVSRRLQKIAREAARLEPGTAA